MTTTAEITRLVEHYEANPEPPGTRWMASHQDGSEEILETPTVEVLRFALGASQTGSVVDVNTTLLRDKSVATVHVLGFVELTRILGLDRRTEP